MAAAIAACDPAQDKPVDEVETPNYSQASYDFKTVYTDGEQFVLPKYDETKFASEHENVVFDVYSNIGNNNYLKLELETDVNLVGYINYYSNEDKTKSHSEKIYVEAGSTEFVTFLDAFRAGANGAYAKTISTIAFHSVDTEKEGTFTLKSVGVNPRSINTNEMMYISDGNMVLGTSAFYGGCITYLELLEQDVYEYMDSDGNICIDRDVDPADVFKVSSDKVNLINIMDLGREVQPSYYSAVDKANGYDPVYDPEDKDSYYQGLTGKPIYNPIQCGDFGDHSPQIIDFYYQADYLYVKMKAQEWFFYTNIQSNGYIECTYYFDKATGAIIVDNVYTDFSEFVGEHDVPSHLQETPATYFVYPFNYFYCETKQGVVFDNNVGEQDGKTQERTGPKSTVKDNYFYAINGKIVTDGWCAFVNENKFGCGIYMPNADRYIASRGRKSNNYYSEQGNSRYYDRFFNFSEDQIIPSYAVYNYDYINPCINRKMVDFIPLEYSYALYVGDTDQMGDVFGSLKDNGTLTNAHLSDTTTGWPKR